jgi:hypothetical protein
MESEIFEVTEVESRMVITEVGGNGWIYWSKDTKLRQKE